MDGAVDELVIGRESISPAGGAVEGAVAGGISVATVVGAGEEPEGGVSVAAEGTEVVTCAVGGAPRSRGVYSVVRCTAGA